MRRIRQHDPLHRRMGDVALVPQRDILQSGLQVGAHHAGEPADRLGGDRVALVGHRRRALLPRLEPLAHLGHLGALEVAELDGDELARRASRREHAQSNSAWRSRAITCVAGTGAQPERVADVALDGRIDVRVRADGAATACRRATVSRAARSRARSRSSCSAHSATLAPNVVGSAWMPWVRPIMTVSRWRRASVDDRGDQLVDAVEQEVGGVAHRPAQRRVDDVDDVSP